MDFEIENLINWNGPFIAIIDDFEIEKEPLYKFDRYGDRKIGKEIVPNATDISVWVTNYPANLETGARRGTGIVMNIPALARLSEETLKLIEKI